MENFYKLLHSPFFVQLLQFYSFGSGVGVLVMNFIYAPKVRIASLPSLIRFKKHLSRRSSLHICFLLLWCLDLHEMFFLMFLITPIFIVLEMSQFLMDVLSFLVLLYLYFCYLLMHRSEVHFFMSSIPFQFLLCWVGTFIKLNIFPPHGTAKPYVVGTKKLLTRGKDAFLAI